MFASMHRSTTLCLSIATMGFASAASAATIGHSAPRRAAASEVSTPTSPVSSVPCTCGTEAEVKMRLEKKTCL